MFGGAVIAKWDTRGWVVQSCGVGVTEGLIEGVRPESLVEYGVCMLDLVPLCLYSCAAGTAGSGTKR